MSDSSLGGHSPCWLMKLMSSLLSWLRPQGISPFRFDRPSNHDGARPVAAGHRAHLEEIDALIAGGLRPMPKGPEASPLVDLQRIDSMLEASQAPPPRHRGPLEGGTAAVALSDSEHASTGPAKNADPSVPAGLSVSDLPAALRRIG
jgi:hypothetical protein